jgi:MobA/MobL family
MAIFHLHANIGTKDKGHSAGQKCAYITRTENYAKKSDECAYTASGNMPKWPKTNPRQDPAHYWKAADLYERDNGRLFREVEFALPRELNLEQQKALCHAFSERLTTLDKGEKLPYTFAIHTDGENKNPHCHLMISERVNDGIPRNASTWFKRANPKEPKKGGAVKTQELNGKQWLEPTRQLWAQMANEAMKSALPDFNVRTDGIDHRSHAKRGLTAFPAEHMGKACHDMMRRGAHCHRGPEVAKRNRMAAIMNRHMHQYPVPRSRIGSAVVNSFRVCSAKHFGGLRADGSPKTMEDIMRDINRLMTEIFNSEMRIAKMQEQQALDEMRRIQEQIRTVNECRDVLGLGDSGALGSASAYRPPAPITLKPQSVAKRSVQKQGKKRPSHFSKPVPPWIKDTRTTE